MTDFTEAGIDPESGLTLKQRLFCDHYLTHLNKRLAYHEAGYKANSAETARKDAEDLMKQPPVAEWLKYKMNERMERLSVRADGVLTELLMIATADVTMFRVNPNNGQCDVVPGTPNLYLKAVQSFKSVSTTRTEETKHRDGTTTRTTTTTWTGEVRCHDKLKALHLLCQHLGLTEAELPPLEVLLNRLPPEVAWHLREILKKPAGYRPESVKDKPN